MRRRCVFLTGAVVMFVSFPARSATTIQTVKSGLWNDSATWDLGTVPTVANVSDAYIINGYAVTNNSAGSTVWRLRVGRYATGMAGVGTLVMSSGDLIGADLYLADNTSSTGMVIQTGGALTITNLFVGGVNAANTQGTLIQSGGTLNAPSNFRVGVKGYGFFNLSGNGVANVAGIRIGYNVGSSGIVTVTGGQLTLAKDVTVGDTAGSYAELNIGGGTVSVNSGKNISATNGTCRIQVTGKWDAGVDNISMTGTGSLFVNSAGSTLACRLNAAGIETIKVGGNADLTGSTLELSFAPGYHGEEIGFSPPSTFDLVTVGGSITTNGMTVNASALPTGYTLLGVNLANSGKTLQVSIRGKPKGTVVSIF